jgi:hypothetical protein
MHEAKIRKYSYKLQNADDFDKKQLDADKINHYKKNIQGQERRMSILIQKQMAKLN